MRHPARILWLLTIAATLLITLIVVGWDDVMAHGPSQVPDASSARVAAPSNGPVLQLAVAASPSDQPARHVQQDVPLLVARECPAPILEDGSLWAQATISALLPLSGVAVFDDVGTPELFEDDVPLNLIEGDLDLDSVLDPGEFWIVGGAFFPSDGALTDTIYASGTDDAANVVQGSAVCDLPPATPPEETVAPTPTTATLEAAEDEFVAAATTPTINKTADAPQIVAGNEIGFTIDVVNPGPDPLYAVQVLDDLPFSGADGLVWDVEVIAGEGSCVITPGEVDVLTCDLGTLDPTETFSVRIFADTTTDDCLFVENEARLNWAITDGGPQDEFMSTGIVTLDVTCPNIVVEIEPDEDEIDAGEEAIFNVTLTVNVEAVDLTLDGVLPDAGPWTVDDSSCLISGTSLHCDLGSPSGSIVYEFSVSRLTDVNDCGLSLVTSVHAEEATSFAAAAEPDADPANDEATISVACPDLRIQQSPDDLVVSAGQDVDFTFEVFNDGAGAAKDIEIIATLPPELAWTIADSGGGDVESSPDCQILGDLSSLELRCTFSPLSSGGSAFVSISAATEPEDCSDTEFDYSTFASVTASNEPPSNPGRNVTSVGFDILCPLLSVDKSAPLSTYSAGSTVDYRMVVRNNGLGNAFDVALTDDLPTGVNWSIEATDDLEEADFDCAITPPDAESGQVLSCTIPNLPSSEQLIVWVEGITDVADCAAPLANTASASASNDALQTPLTADATITILCPDLSLTKTASASEVSPGETVTYTLEVTNAGPGDGFGVHILDDVPDNVDWEVVPETPGCAVAEGALNCNLGNIAPGTYTVTVEGTPGTDDCGALANSASLEATNHETVIVEPVTVTVTCSPTLRLVNTATASQVDAGQFATYSLEVFNDGPGAASGVVLTDTLPAGIEWNADPPTFCSIDGQQLECLISEIGNGGSFSVDLEGQTDVDDCAAPLTNNASVEASNSPAVGAEPISITVICPGPELELTKFPTNETGGTISAGDVASFTIIVNNSGGGEATDVVLTDPLPAGIAWSEVSDTACTIDGTTLTCDIGTMGPDGSDTDRFEVVVEGQTDPLACADLENTASLDAAHLTEPLISSFTIQVNCPALSITKEAGGDVSVGETAEFVITVANAGPGEAIDVTIEDELPAGIDWTVNNEGCTIDGDILTCLGSIAATGSVSFTVTGETDIDDCGVLTNTASVSALNHAEIESAPATVTVNCAELLVTKVAEDSEIGAGETAEYLITVSNEGDATATGVTFEDALPNGIEWTGDNDDCVISDSTLNCSVGDLPPTEAFSVTISGTTGPEDCGEISNTVTASASNAESFTSEPAIITILCPGVALTKEADAEAVAAGDDIGFTMTVNNPQVANALGVSLTDELPDVAGLDWSVDGEDAGDCAIDDGVLSCDFGTLPGGEDRVVHVTSPTTAESCGVIENTATVEADNEPSNLGENNTDTASVTVDCASIAVVKIATDGLGTEIDTADVGDTITYLYFVANTGGVPLTDVAVLDDHFTVEGNLCPAGTTLAPDDGVPGSGDDEIVCAAEYLVGELDITDDDGLTLTNLATASGVSPLEDEVTGTDDATVTINEPKEPCQFPVTFTFSTDVDFVDDEGNVLFTLPAGLTFSFEPGEVNERGGCTMPFTIAGSPAGVPVLARGTMSISVEVGPQVGVRALVTDARVLIEVTEVTAWAVPGVPAPEPEVEEVSATVIVSGPVLEIEAGEAKAVIMVEPELEIPFVQTEAYTVSTPEVPNTGAGVTASLNAGAGALAGLVTMLPVVAAAAYRRRRPAVGR